MRVEKIRKDFLAFIQKAIRDGVTIAGHGAAAKANTLLNYCGVTNEQIAFVSDNSPHKQGLFMPGSHIPVVHPDVHKKEKPGYIIIFPWNIKEEIMNQFGFARQWNAKFVTVIPELKIF